MSKRKKKEKAEVKKTEEKIEELYDEVRLPYSEDMPEESEAAKAAEDRIRELSAKVEEKAPEESADVETQKEEDTAAKTETEEKTKAEEEPESETEAEVEEESEPEEEKIEEEVKAEEKVESEAEREEDEETKAEEEPEPEVKEEAEAKAEEETEPEDKKEEEVKAEEEPEPEAKEEAETEIKEEAKVEEEAAEEQEEPKEEHEDPGVEAVEEYVEEEAEDSGEEIEEAEAVEEAEEESAEEAEEAEETEEAEEPEEPEEEYGEYEYAEEPEPLPPAGNRGRKRRFFKRYSIIVVPENSVNVKTYKVTKLPFIILGILAAVALIAVILGLNYGIKNIKDLRNQVIALNANILHVTNANVLLEADKEELENELREANAKLSTTTYVQEQAQSAQAMDHIPSGLPLDGQAGLPSKYTEETQYITFNTGMGSKIIATGAGSVKSIFDDNRLGHVIQIDHGNGYISVYYSPSEPLVKEGDNVIRGTMLYIVQGDAETLTYQIMYNGKYIDPATIMRIDG